jgi:SnoaL-like domain
MSVEDFRAGGEAHDIELAMSACAEDIVVHSPLTDHLDFRGQAQVRQLFEVVYERLDDIRYREQVGDGDRRVLVGTASVGGQRIEETLLLRLDDRGKIAEITFFIRPLPGLAAVMAALGPALARRNGRSRFTVGLLKVMVAPLVAGTRFGDRTGVRMASPKS